MIKKRKKWKEKQLPCPAKLSGRHVACAKGAWPDEPSLPFHFPPSPCFFRLRDSNDSTSWGDDRQEKKWGRSEPS